jgi:BirA family transcriptional regulator, biotin operon repressor / biotin---[acetyl-CoA-carboxylase] ligase
MISGWTLESFDSVPSTMEIAHRTAKNGARRHAVIAKTQSAGRGRQGRTWQSDTGNLYCSMVLGIADAPRLWGQYSFIAAVALASAVKPLLKDKEVFAQKWPNDGLLSGRKFAGILLETERDDTGAPYLVLGIGVNIASAPEGGARLADRSDATLSPRAFLKSYLAALDEWCAIYDRLGFAAIRDAWLSDAAQKHRTVTARLPHETLSGVFEDIDTEGSLVLALEDGTRRVIHSGDVFFGKEA